MKKLSQVRRSTHGFTLVELIIVIAVIGLLAAILIPVFSNVIKKANAKSALSDARNSVENYLTYALEDPSLPRNLVIIVEKANRFYLYGYNTEVGGSLMISTGNPFTAESVSELVDNYSWNSLQGTDYNPDVDEATLNSYTIEEHGAFYLVPYNNQGESQNPNVRGFNRDAAAYRCVSNEIESIGANMAIYHGCLVGNNYTHNTDNDGTNSGSTNHGTNNGGNTSNTAQWTVNINLNGVDVSELTNASYPMSYTISEGDALTGVETPVLADGSKVFDGWKIENAGDNVAAPISIPSNGITLYAQWVAGTKLITISDNWNDGTSDHQVDISGQPEGFSGGLTWNAPYGTNLNDIVEGLTAQLHTPVAGKNFDHWTINGAVYNSGNSYLLNANTTIAAVFGTSDVTVNFEANNTVVASLTVPFGSSIAAGDWPANPTETGANPHPFKHWTYDNGTGSYTGEYISVYPNAIEPASGLTVTFKAVFGAYRVTFYDTDGTTTLSSTANAQGNYPIPSPTIGTWYYHDSWTKSAGADDCALTGTYTPNKDNITLTAHQTSKTAAVTFVSSPTGATGMPENQTVQLASGQTINLTTPSMTGNYDFTGYSVTSADGITATISGSTLTLSNPTANASTVTVTASFEEQQAQGHDVTFTITYKKYNNTLWSGSESDWQKTYTRSCTVGENTITYSELVAAGAWSPQYNSRDMIGCELNARTNYLIEWTVTIASESVTTYDLTIYTYYAPSSNSVTYNANGGEGSVTDSNTYSLGDTATALPNAFTRTYYNFTSWNTKADGSGTTINPGDTFTVVGTTTLYAQWELQPGVVFKTVSYDANVANGGYSSHAAFVPDSVTVNRGETIYVSDNCTNKNCTTSPALISSISGYTFIGWNTSADNTGTFYSAQDIVTGHATMQVMDDTVLYAIYGPTISQTTCNIVIHKNASDATVYKTGYDNGYGTSTVPVYDGESLTFELQAVGRPMQFYQEVFVRPGYYLDGYCTSPDGNGTFYPLWANSKRAPQITLCASEINLYAIWRNGNFPSYTYSLTFSYGALNITHQFTNMTPVAYHRQNNGAYQYDYVFNVNDLLALVDTLDPAYTHSISTSSSDYVYINPDNTIVKYGTINNPTAPTTQTTNLIVRGALR